MSNNLTLDQMTAGQDDKFQTNNDGNGQLDAAITEELLTLITSTNIRTLTTLEFQRQMVFVIADGAPVPTAAITLTVPAVQRGIFGIRNTTSFAVTVTISGQAVTPPVVATGSSDITTILVCDGVNVRQLASGGSAGATVFTGLTDTPANYTSQSLKLVRVNTGETALEFVNPGAAGGAPNSFTGLWGGTRNAENNVDSDAKVHLDRLKVGTFDDGASVVDVADLQLDTGTTGAGGLDTGTLTNNSWYIWWLIQRSDTEALALLGSLASDWDTDQTNASNDADFRLRNTSAETNGAQSFQPSVTADLLYLDLFIGETGTVPSNTFIWITIEADSAGNPSGTPLATSIKIRADLIAAADKEVKFAFPAPAALTASTTYWMVFHGDYVISATNHITIRGNTTSTYASGLAKDFDGVSTWTTPADGAIVDFWFRTHMDNFTAPSMPANYDRKLKLGYFYVDGTTDIEPFRCINNHVEYHGDIITTLNPGTGVQGLKDMKVALPPSPCVVHLMVSHGIGGEVRVSGIPYGAVDIGQTTPPVVPQHSVREADPNVSTELHSIGPLITEGQALYMAHIGTTATITLHVLAYEWVD